MVNISYERNLKFGISLIVLNFDPTLCMCLHDNENMYVAKEIAKIEHDVICICPDRDKIENVRYQLEVCGFVKYKDIPSIAYLLCHEMGHHFTREDDVVNQHHIHRLQRERYFECIDSKKHTIKAIEAYHTKIDWERMANEWMQDNVLQAMSFIRLKMRYIK